MPAEDSSCCRSCQSHNKNTFDAEIAVQFRGFKGLNKPIVWVFPKLLVCLDCGVTEFLLPERELRVLKGGTPVEGALVQRDETVPKNKRE
jgi:hypothetical protein